ncbi:DUF998 domain-containing protein [Streptomyces sp. MUSC 14]|uniref:DUF998 domain-containing protein n=1 Tax=Streptomyces sp. MUSC 14 TaxID=1354889 RepID=UPI00210DCC34|nr:DUF998 domain-containing protein [Streptomyces sp. MUSC 14]
MTRGPARGAASTVASVLLCVAAVLYNDWLLQFFVTTGLPQASSYVSETFAADQPHRLLFGTVELFCAAILIAAAALAARAVPWGLALAGWSAVGVFGGCSVLDVLLPMGCAPSVEHGCPPDNFQHTTTSGLVECALFMSMALFGLAVRRPVLGRGRPVPGRRGPVAGRWVPYLMPVSMASAIATVGPYLGHPGGQGIAQRIHLVSVAVWFVLLAVEARRAGSQPGRRERDPGRGPGRGGRDGVQAALAGARPLPPPLPDAPPARAHGYATPDRRSRPSRAPRPPSDPGGRRGRIRDGQ